MNDLIVTSPTNSRIAQGKKLTGIPRHISDLAADIYNNIQQWNNLHIHGLSILKKICNLKINKNYSQELQMQCDKLEGICNSMDLIVKNLELLNQQIKSSITLHKTSNKLFKTWSSSLFRETVERIHMAYSQEVKVKHKVLENIAHCSTESAEMLYLATWVHEPFISIDIAVTLESLLIETGHR